MKKSILSMIAVILCGLTAQAAQVHCEGKEKSLDFQVTDVGATQASFDYQYMTYGHCPSRLCGSSYPQAVSANTEDGTVVAKTSMTATRVAATYRLQLLQISDNAKVFEVVYSLNYENAVTLQALNIGGNAVDFSGLACKLVQ